MTRNRAPVEVGTRFGRLTVVGEGPLHPTQRERMLRCLCDCGAICVITYRNLRNENTRSCGCYQREMRTRANPARLRQLHITKD